RLIGHGRAGSTPFALVENGSRPEQRVVSGQLQDLARVARRHDVRSPALLIVGEVAALADSLHWYGRHLPDTPAALAACHPPARAGPGAVILASAWCQICGRPHRPGPA